MFEMFKSEPFMDSTLGEFRRKRGLWRGAIDVGDGGVPLALPGSRSTPDPKALDIAHIIPSTYSQWRTIIETALFEHFAPYAEAVAAGEAQPGEELPHITRPDEVWPHVAIEFIAVVAVDGELGVDIGYRVAWDEEHTLGARLRNGQLMELNGSVLPP